MVSSGRYFQNSTDLKQMIYFLKLKNDPSKHWKKSLKRWKNWKKRPHCITVQCITRIYRYVGARLVHYFKNESQIKILNIPLVLEKNSKTSILDHIYLHIYVFSTFFLNPSASLASNTIVCLQCQDLPGKYLQTNMRIISKWLKVTPHWQILSSVKRILLEHVQS